MIVNDREYIKTTQAVLAVGHSARDTFEYLDKIGIPMEAKAFAVGLRVEHPQRLINENMYGIMERASHENNEKSVNKGKSGREDISSLPAARPVRHCSGIFHLDGSVHKKIKLPPAPYKLTAQTSTGRGVYSFCMCPGGYVVNASSEPGRTAVNGMSYSDRGSRNANSAIIVQVTPADYGDDGPLAGIAFQRALEEKAYELGKGRIPVQYYGDYVKDSVSEKGVHDWNEPCTKGACEFTNLRGLLPADCEKAFMEAMEQFDRTIRGYAAQDAILSGVESRTSSPVRIHRTDELQSPTVRGLYPCGEGAGYAGGITSAAMDGILTAEKIAMQFKLF